MPRGVVTRTIAAPIETVFGTVADISRFSRAIPQIVKVEFLWVVHSGVGTRFGETRLRRGMVVSPELVVTVGNEHDRVRLVADPHGTIWDSVFLVRRGQGGTVLTLTMDSRATGVIPRVLTFFIRGMVQKALEGDMDSVKAYCEREAAP